MLSIVTAVAVGVLAVAIVWGGYLWAFRTVAASHDGITADFLVGLGRGLGLDAYSERELFGEHVRVLSGGFADLVVELEVADGDWVPYVRLVVEFDRPLARGVSVFSDDRSGVVSYVQRVRELEIDEDQFDYRFLLYGPDDDAIEDLLPGPTRHQMLLLDDDVDELRLTDNALFAYAAMPVDQDQLKSILKKGVELADRIDKTARELGPSRPETSASQYEQATIEQVVRTESRRTTRSTERD